MSSASPMVMLRHGQLALFCSVSGGQREEIDASFVVLAKPSLLLHLLTCGAAPGTLWKANPWNGHVPREGKTQSLSPGLPNWVFDYFH